MAPLPRLAGSILSAVMAVSLPLYSAHGTRESAQGTREGLTPSGLGRPLAEVYADGSYAILVGVSRYDIPTWNALPSIPDELDEVANALSQAGFDQIVRVQNPTSSQLREAVQTFVAQFGFQGKARLVFFFAGHGYTLDGDRGFFVPRDAPDPTVDESGFRAKALSMGQVVQWASDLTALHVLFAFDSCFSGTIFQSRGLTRAEVVSSVTSSPVRMFLSAGGAGDAVPSRSVFTPAFVEGLEGSADIDNNGLVTGSELGVHVSRRVISNGKGQTPQFGKSSDPKFAKGDIVFAVPGGPRATIEPGPLPRTAKPRVPPAEADREAVRAVVKQFEEAYRRLDADALKVIWPSGPDLKQAMREITWYQVNLSDVDIAVAGDRATVTCRRRTTVQYSVGSPQSTNSPMTIALARRDSGWIISEVK